MTKAKRAYCLNTIIPDLKKAGVTLQQISAEIDYRTEYDVDDGIDGSDEALKYYSTEELCDAEKLWNKVKE